jgi:hypothetical protein
MTHRGRDTTVADEDTLVTAVDGRIVGVSVNTETEVVHLMIGLSTVIDLSPDAARELAAALTNAAAAPRT